MRREPARGLVQHLPVIFPGLMLTVFFIVPFGTMVAVSFFRRQQGGFYVPDFVLANYARFLTPFFGNVLALLMIAAGILEQFAAWIAWLGCMTMALCGVMIADYYLGRRQRPPTQVENCNWAGVITLMVSSAVGIALIHSQVFPCGFLVTLVMTFLLYPLLRKWLPDGTATHYVAEHAALEEAL